jgi:predicted dehydrogenase
VASVVFFTNRFRAPVADFLRDAVAAGGWDGGRATILAQVAGGPYGDSPWRAERGGLWDVGPHALSLLVPVLGPVRSVAAAVGPHATTHVLLGHAAGAVSTMTLSLAAPDAARTWEVVFVGWHGWASVPSGGDAVEAYRRAVAELARTAVEGRTDHPCDVRFGREVVAVLAEAEAQSRGASADRR